MVKDINCDRRRFLGAAIMTLAAAGPLVAGSADARVEAAGQAQLTGRPAAAKVSFSSLKQIDAGAGGSAPAND